MLNLTFLRVVAETRGPINVYCIIYNYIYVYIIQLKIHHATYTLTGPIKSTEVLWKRFADRAIYLHSAFLLKMRVPWKQLSIFRQTESKQDDSSRGHPDKLAPSTSRH